MNAVVPDLQIVIVARKTTPGRPTEIKGIGEVGIVGMNAAVVAPPSSTPPGKRIRDLPIRIEKLL